MSALYYSALFQFQSPPFLRLNKDFPLKMNGKMVPEELGDKHSNPVVNHHPPHETCLFWGPISPMQLTRSETAPSQKGEKKSAGDKVISTSKLT